MSAPVDPIRAATRDQGIVSDPNVSAWVNASAGAGKTKVLTDRVLRLMLSGVAPERILCLTFTKAAAAEMANRISGTLAGWATMPVDQLRQKLTELTGRAGDGNIVRARTLFARVVDAPGGLKVQTVHGFCQAALERFPVEAGAPPGFQALDDRAADRLLTAARDDTLDAIVQGRATATLAAALDRIAASGAEDRLDTLLRALLSEQARLGKFASPADVELASLKAFGLADEATAIARLSAPLELPPAIAADLPHLADALAAGGKDDKKRGDTLKTWLARSPTARRDRFADFASVFFTKDGDGPPRAKFAVKKVMENDPSLAEAADGASAFADAERDRIRTAIAACDTLAALRLADDVARRYAMQKVRLGALDFDDLILKTRDLLTKDNGAGWALYKLDKGVDHILVDEAQDTNPEQWQIVHALAGEFFQQMDVDVDERTIFAVGDPKQSIFSFQRADPAAFGKSHDHFKAAAETAGKAFEPRPLAVSFRSVTTVLEAVDAVFTQPEAADGVTPDGLPPKHTAARQGLPGRVELWPLIAADAAPDRDIWEPHADYPDAKRTAPAKLAEAVATRIAALIADPAERIAESNENPHGRIRPRDIMVVVQQRRPFVELLARALKARAVPTAGVDRMRLATQLVVSDLLALGQAASLPEDDLAVATLLKSPLGGLSEQTLFDLAYRRGRMPLWRRLKQAATAADAPADIARAWDFVREAMARADFAPPFAFYQWALGPMQGRARLVANMGPGVLDPLDEFLALALRHGREGPASLTGFLAAAARDSIELKRESEAENAGVRILTAHAAKGLQAPVVFLPDTTRAPEGRAPALYWADDAPVLATSRAREPDKLAGLRGAASAAAAAERRRLLYVAMTRAEDRLYIAGWRGQNKDTGRPDGSWRALVEAGFETLRSTGRLTVAETAASFDDDPILVYADPVTRPPPTETTEPPTARRQDAPDQSWLERPAPARPDGGAIQAPSGVVVDRAEFPPAALSPLARDMRGAAEARRFARGLLIHRLLERLPNLEGAARQEAGARYLDQHSGLAAAAQDKLLSDILALLDNPAFGPIFAPGALAEAPIAGTLAGRRYAGVLDRLAIEPDCVRIVDIKSNRPPPDGPSATPEAYLKQMAIYRDLARQAFPGRAVHVGLLWTEAPRLDPLDDHLLDPFAPGA